MVTNNIVWFSLQQFVQFAFFFPTKRQTANIDYIVCYLSQVSRKIFFLALLCYTSQFDFDFGLRISSTHSDNKSHKGQCLTSHDVESFGEVR